MKLYELLSTIICHNWYCGEITALYAWSNGCTIESRTEQQKIRRILARNGYKAHFGGCILSIEKA